MKILVTGGAGYIGSIAVKEIVNSGHEVIVLDNLSKGYKKSLEGVDCRFIKGDLNDKIALSRVFKDEEIDAVVHFAGFIEAGKSMESPGEFYENNVCNGVNLLEAMVENSVKKIIFSSSAGIYEAKERSLKEEDEKGPASVYGETKLLFERMLLWYDQVHDIKSISLRYFNAAGATEFNGECHNPETHLIPLTMFAALGKRKDIKIFGTDYDTPDGTCVRDYIHVKDLAKAHVVALESISSESKAYNVGTGKGHSVKEIINLVKEVSGIDFDVLESEKREGDAAILVADSTRIREELGWEPEHGIKEIIGSAWEWHKNHPEGYL